MNKDKIRQQFKYYRQVIAELRDELESASYYHEESISRANARARAAENERVERERQAESDRWNRESELSDATKALERAHSYGDEYSIHRAMEKLKRLS